MQGKHGSEGVRYDRAQLLRLGTLAAAPLVLGLPAARAAIADDVIHGRRARLAARLKNGELAWWPTWGGGYHYVPRRVLTTQESAAFVARRLNRFGAKPFIEPRTAEAFKFAGIAELQVAVQKPAVPQILAGTFGKEASSRREPAVAPHYVLFGEPEYERGPFGPPTPAAAETPYAPAPPEGGPRVAVIDTGYHWGIHPDLDAHVLPKAGASQLPDVTPHDSVLDDEAAHGLFITGIIVRLAQTVTVEIVRALDGLGLAKEGTIVAALTAFARRGDVNVINLSLGALGDPRFPPVGLAQALARLPSTTAVVAAAGNNHTNQPMYPAAFARVVGVAAAADRSGTPAVFTNYGPWVDCYAPGVDVPSAFDDWNGLVPTNPQSTETFNGWATWNGTSFAAPKVSGTIAALVGPAATGQQAADALVNDPTRPWRADYGRFLDL